MTKQYNISEAAYFPSTPKIKIHRILVIVLFILLPLGIWLYYFSSHLNSWFPIFMYLSAIVPQLLMFYINEKKRKRTILKEYVITLNDDFITQKIPYSSFTGFSFLHSKPLPTVNIIKYKEITQIKKTGNGSLVIIAFTNSQFKAIAIPYYMEAFEDLAIELAEICPIINPTKDSSEATFTIKEAGLKTMKKDAYKIITFVICSISSSWVGYLFFTQDNFDWAFWAIAISLFCLLAFWGTTVLLHKQYVQFKNYRLTLNDQLIIQEQDKAISVLPIQEIAKINQSYGGAFSIIDHKSLMDKRFGRSISINHYVDNKDALIERLNSILPITYSGFRRNS